MKHIRRYNKFNLQTSCRLCLTETMGKRFPLSSPLKGEQSPVILVHEALELVTGEKISLGPKYPDSVCGMCLELLKMAYDLVLQYQVSKRRLKERLKQLGEDYTDSESLSGEDDQVEKNNSKAPVEIFVGSEKFNIKDLFIVEEESDDDVSFDGFLQNLGKTVTASFVRKGSQKPKTNIESHSLIIKKVPQEPSATVSPDATVCVEQTSVDQVNNVVACIDENNENHYTDKPANTEVFGNLMELNDTDKDILKSALNLNYKCPYCSKPMASLTRAKIHSRNCKKNNTNVTCYICKAKFELRKYLLKHINDVHLSDTRRVNGTILEKRCRTCGKVFTNAGTLFYHMKKHSERKHGCDKCDKRFYTKTQVRIHSQIHDRHKTVVMCPICGKSFHYQSGLFYHMKTHTNERHIQCSYCPRRFYSRTSVKRHELTHTGVRPYACKFCDKKFRSTSEVKKHELLHTGERPFKCEHCNMGFRQAHNLKIHLMTHPGDFSCPNCTHTFVTVDILRFHLRIKHKVEVSFILNEDQEEGSEEQSNNQEEITQGEEIFSGCQVALSTVPEEIHLEHGSFFIAEQYEVDQDTHQSDNIIVKTYEIRDEVLVETVDNLN